MTSICHSCHAGCCRAFAVPITGADVLRLERATGLQFWDFACRWADPEGTIAGDYAPHLFFDDEPSTPFTLCLLHEPSRTIAGTSKCRFLQETAAEEAAPLGTGRCGVYDHRPSSCRVFPLNLRASSLLTVLGDVPVQGRPSDGHAVYQLCPRSWEPSDVDPISGPQDVAAARFETEFFHQVAELWNQQPGPWLKFPEFLRLVYEQRVVKPATEGQQAETDKSVECITLPFSRQQRFAA